MDLLEETACQAFSNFSSIFLSEVSQGSEKKKSPDLFYLGVKMVIVYYKSSNSSKV